MIKMKCKFIHLLILQCPLIFLLIRKLKTLSKNNKTQTLQRQFYPIIPINSKEKLTVDRIMYQYTAFQKFKNAKLKIHKT